MEWVVLPITPVPLAAHHPVGTNGATVTAHMNPALFLVLPGPEKSLRHF